MTDLFPAAVWRRPARMLAAGMGLWLLALLPAAQAQDAGKVVARVNGSAITEADMATAAEDLGDTLARYPAAQHKSILIDVLVNQKLLAAAGEKEGLADTDQFRQRMAVLRERALRDAYFDEKVFSAVTEEDLRKTYEEAIAKVEPEQEVRARHILVESEDDAKAIVAELQKGTDFAELAKQKGTDPTASNGGDLGYFGKDDMVAPFAEAAFALEVGQISQPVKSEFGWHVIKVEDKRQRPAPDYELVKEQIRQAVVRERFAALVEELKADAEIEIVEEPVKAE